MAAVVVAAFHHQRVLPLIKGVQMSAVTLSNKEILRRVRETVEGRLRSIGLTPFLMRPTRGYISLGMRDVRASTLPVLEDTEWRAVNRAHAEAQKKRKDPKEARCKRKNLECEELEKCRWQQRHDGLPVEPSPSPSLSDSSSDDDECKKRQAEAPTLAPRKALKVSTSSTAQWVMEAQATIQRGTASARAYPKEPVAQGEATKAAMRQAGEEAPTPREAEAHESDEAEAPSAAEATKGEAEDPRASEAEETEAGVSRTTEAEVAEAGAPRTTEANVVEAGLEKEVSRAVEASIEVQALQGALHAGVVSSRYANIDLEAVSDGYVLAEDDEEAKEEVMKLVEVAEAPGTVLAKLFEDEVVPPAPTTDAGDPEF
ncbi:uncharacterized protein [Miscanthus floridulus]|uniref:uncharacterized protein n=1 Tax=Miscanthus floridulus TaxID=154761 RepID=UPI003457FD44